MSRWIFFLIAVIVSQLIGAKEAKASFNCGPNYVTYRVRSVDGRVGDGVRCVGFGIGSAQYPNRPVITWYGEGFWGSALYRHIGHAFYSASAYQRGYAADIFGNGENTQGAFNGNLTLFFSAERPFPNSIRVQGAWNELWVRDSSPSGYTSRLGRVSRCGRLFREFHVEDRANQPRVGGGVRCILPYAPANYRALGFTWYGDGWWYRSNYAHLGSYGLRGFGASDICEPSKYQICGAAPFGSLTFTPLGNGYEVRGAWAEAWIPQ